MTAPKATPKLEVEVLPQAPFDPSTLQAPAMDPAFTKMAEAQALQQAALQAQIDALNSQMREQAQKIGFVPFDDKPQPLESVGKIETMAGLEGVIKMTKSKRVPAYDIATGTISWIDPIDDHVFDLLDRETGALVFSRTPTDEWERNRPVMVKCPYCPKPEPMVVKVDHTALDDLGFTAANDKDNRRSAILYHMKAWHPEQLASHYARGEVTEIEIAALSAL